MTANYDLTNVILVLPSFIFLTATLTKEKNPKTITVSFFSKCFKIFQIKIKITSLLRSKRLCFYLLLVPSLNELSISKRISFRDLRKRSLQTKIQLKSFQLFISKFFIKWSDHNREIRLRSNKYYQESSSVSSMCGGSRFQSRHSALSPIHVQLSVLHPAMFRCVLKSISNGFGGIML